MMETAITALASHVLPFTSVRAAAQALPFSELRWEMFEKLTHMDLEKACAAFFARGWLARNDSTSPCNVQGIASGRRRFRFGLNLPVATDRYRPRADVYGKRS
ncbi:hypothetical protein [Pseudomonas syringae]|uniref:hypothetical protein n=1 Tax=Pseudomonas syringae TaxID=317 RepID=UPI001D0C2B70|nr:hypothetical protein [Pseudomonas syringae]